MTKDTRSQYEKLRRAYLEASGRLEKQCVEDWLKSARDSKSWQGTAEFMARRFRHWRRAEEAARPDIPSVETTHRLLLEITERRARGELPRAPRRLVDGKVIETTAEVVK